MPQQQPPPEVSAKDQAASTWASFGSLWNQAPQLTSANPLASISNMATAASENLKKKAEAAQEQYRLKLEKQEEERKLKEKQDRQDAKRKAKQLKKAQELEAMEKEE